MKRSNWLLLLFVAGGSSLHAQWAVVNVSDVVNWGNQARQMAEQINTARQYVQTANTIVGYVGNPKDAVKNLSDLGRISQSLANIVGPGATADALMDASKFFNEAGAAQNATNGLLNSIEGLQQDVSVFGKKQTRHTDLYRALGAAEEMARITRSYIKKSSETREEARKKLEEAWKKLNEADMDEAKRDALIGQIAQLQAQLQLLEGQQAAMLADMQVQAQLERNKQEAVQRGLEEKSHAEGSQNQESYKTRQQGMAELKSEAMATTQQTPTDWNSTLTPRWRPPGS